MFFFSCCGPTKVETVTEIPQTSLLDEAHPTLLSSVPAYGKAPASKPQVVKTFAFDQQRAEYPSSSDQASGPGGGTETSVAGGGPRTKPAEHRRDHPAGGDLAAAGDQAWDFGTSAARGRRCVRLSAGEGARAEARYFVDADSGQFVLKTAGGAGPQETVAFPIASIEDIYTMGDGEDCFPRHISEALAPEEKAQIFLIVQATDDPKAPELLYLVEGSESARDELLRHLLELVSF